jgi:glycosyltransferase involved in cell wall biosynthesis
VTVVRHIITGEFPPNPGGVSDYTAVVARALADAGEDVHVWTGGCEPAAPAGDRVTVHRSLGTFDRRSLADAGVALDTFPAPRRLLVQWVPHAYGRSSMNLAFCLWVWRRVRGHGDVLDVMVHEPFLRFGFGLKQTVAAAVHRVMVSVLMRAASRIYVGTTTWEPLCRPYAKRVAFTWTPVPSGIARTAGAEAAGVVRAALAVGPETTLIGSFGRVGSEQHGGFVQSLLALERDRRPAVLLLIGAGGDDTRTSIISENPRLAARVHATGAVPPGEVSRYLRACDLVLQPYHDGICGRRSGAMAALSHGCAMITTDGDFTEPIWRESGAVRLVPAGNIDRLAAAVVAVAGDAEERTRLSERATALYDRWFDVRHTVAAIREPRQGTA